MKKTPLPWVPLGRIENLRGSRRLAAPPLLHWVPAALAAAPRQGFWGSFGPRASKCVTMHHDAFPVRYIWASLCPRKASRVAWGLPRLAPRAAGNPRFVRSLRDFKASLRSAV